MPYWMQKEGGVMPAYDTGEVDRLKAIGWKLLNEGPRPLRAKPEGAAHVDAVKTAIASETKPAKK